jgi:ribonuclease P protein component
LSIPRIRHTYSREERLKREQHIATLFRTGKAFSVFPLRVIYLDVPRPGLEGTSPVQTGFSVPKKKWRNAADRNKIKRLMREAWRLQKHILYAALPEKLQLHLFFIFTDTRKAKYATIHACVETSINRLIKTYEAHE